VRASPSAAAQEHRPVTAGLLRARAGGGAAAAGARQRARQRWHARQRRQQLAHALSAPARRARRGGAGAARGTHVLPALSGASTTSSRRHGHRDAPSAHLPLFEGGGLEFIQFYLVGELSMHASSPMLQTGLLLDRPAWAAVGTRLQAHIRVALALDLPCMRHGSCWVQSCLTYFHFFPCSVYGAQAHL